MLDNLSKQKDVKKNIKKVQEELNDLIIKKYDSLNETFKKKMSEVYKKQVDDLEMLVVA